MNGATSLALSATTMLGLTSPLASVSDEDWTRFTRAMMTAHFRDVSPSNGLGAFEFKPRRLVDLGVLSSVARTRSERSRRVIWAATKETDHDQARVFLKSPSMQLRAFAHSLADYASKISSGTVKLPPGCTLSGALAICHRAGLAGLSGNRFPDTQAAYERTNGMF